MSPTDFSPSDPWSRAGRDDDGHLPYPHSHQGYPQSSLPRNDSLRFALYPPNPSYHDEPVQAPSRSLPQYPKNPYDDDGTCPARRPGEFTSPRVTAPPSIGPVRPLERITNSPTLQSTYPPISKMEGYGSMRPPGPVQAPGFHGHGFQGDPSSTQGYQEAEPGSSLFPIGTSRTNEYASVSAYTDYSRRSSTTSVKAGASPAGKPHHTQKRSNRDEFDGPIQYLRRPSLNTINAQERELPHVPIHLDAQEQDRVFTQVNQYLSRCAFDFVAKYQFPIPLEADKRPVEQPGDREWTEWAYLLKRLATKRRIPTRVLYQGQIKQLVTVLENSLEMRHASAQQPRPPKDDRNVLQLISAGTQVAKMLKDASIMECLDKLYQQTEWLIQERKAMPLGRP